MDDCPICRKERLDDDRQLAMQACTSCARRLGIVPMPEPSREARPCRGCGGTRFLHAIPREHSTVHLGDADQVSAPMFLTHEPTVMIGVLNRRPRGPADEHEPATDRFITIEQGYGRLEVYACLACGLVEWFCRDVAAVPIHPHLMTQVIDYAGDAPYR